MSTVQPLAPLFRLLSSLYLCPPTADALAGWQALVRSQPAPDLDELKAALDAIDVPSAQVREDVLWEYTRLFVGPYRLPCPPWESVYTSSGRLLMQEAHDAVKAAYAAAGVELGDPSVLPDHVGAELNFLAILLERAERDAADGASARELADQFSRQHLCNWLPRFTADLEAAAQQALYRALARGTRNLLRHVGDTSSDVPSPG